MDTTITTLEMCAGYGGIGLGLKNIFGERMRTIAYCELEGFAQANLISKMEKGLLDAAPIWSDLKTFPYESFHGLVDILIAGYPCQPFSSAGKRAGKDDPRHLWPWIADGIRLLQPRMCFFENVEGHISLGLSTVISNLEELGYQVSWGIFSASEVNAPHQRKRVFILAYSVSAGREGRLPEWAHPQWQGVDGHAGRCGAGASGDWTTWPSRPDEPQHSWEPPRVVGNATSGRWRQCNSGFGSVSQSDKGYADTSECSEIECEVGRDAYEPFIRVDISELFGLCDSELAEIREWMVKCDNRTDELRLLGNGVAPATATRAFLTLMEEINK